MLDSMKSLYVEGAGGTHFELNKRSWIEIRYLPNHIRFENYHYESFGSHLI